MKKIWSMILTICLVCTLFACGSKPEDGESQLRNQETAEVLQSPAKEEKPSPFEIKPSVANGAGTESVWDWGIENVEPDTLPDSMPVYRDFFPVSHPGPMYTVSAQQGESVTEDLRGFLQSYYESLGTPKAPEEIEITPPSEEVFAQQHYFQAAHTGEGMEAYAWLDHMIMLSFQSTSVQELKQAVEAGDTKGILESDYLKAALEYLGIENPEIEDQRTPNASGEVTEYQYKVVEKKEGLEDKVVQRAFSSLTVHKFASLDTITVLCHRSDLPVSWRLPCVSYEDALHYLKEKHPEEGVEEMKLSVYYDRSVEFGLYIPCYLFSNESTRFCIPMVDYTGIEKSEYEPELVIGTDGRLHPNEQVQSAFSGSSEPEPVSSELSEPETVTSLPPEEN